MPCRESPACRGIEADGGACEWLQSWRRHWRAGAIFALGLVVTVVLTVSSAVSYADNQRRLTSLQTRLTASVLQTAQPQLQAILGRVIGLTATASDPLATFETEMTGQLAPKGPFASATVAVVSAGQVRVLGHIGSAPLQGLTSQATTAVFLQASRTSTLVTDRIVAAGSQKLGYLLSAKGRNGVYVVGASQELPVGRRVPVSAGSPDANLNIALYFGSSINPAALVETNAGRLPLSGTVTKATIPFGNNVLTLVASPRGSLAGTWAQYLPWGILGFGILFSIAAAAVTGNLVRRHRTAEALYRQQRTLSETLQHSLLPRRLPDIAGWEFAARYLPATKGAEIGGDWYSVVQVDDHRFALVVGDVSGHDLAAAGVMAALRYTIRTLAKQGIPPDEILDRANEELDVVTDQHFATVLVGVVDTRMQEMTLASAGHPPPLLVHQQGRPEYLRVPPGLPLGLPSRARPRPTTVYLAPGTTLVAFTDGLIEKRTQSLEVGLAQLATAADGPGPPVGLIDRIVGALVGPDQDDDIAILVIQFSTQDAMTPTPQDSQADIDILTDPTPS